MSSYKTAHLSSEVLLLKVSQYSERNSRETECQLESNITTVFRSAKLANWSSEPDLSHTKNSTHDAEAEGGDGCDSRGKFAPVHVDAWVVASHPALVEDVL